MNNYNQNQQFTQNKNLYPNTNQSQYQNGQFNPMNQQQAFQQQRYGNVQGNVQQNYYPQNNYQNVNMMQQPNINMIQQPMNMNYNQQHNYNQQYKQTLNYQPVQNQPMNMNSQFQNSLQYQPVPQVHKVPRTNQFNQINHNKPQNNVQPQFKPINVKQKVNSQQFKPMNNIKQPMNYNRFQPMNINSGINKPNNQAMGMNQINNRMVNHFQPNMNNQFQSQKNNFNNVQRPQNFVMNRNKKIGQVKKPIKPVKPMTRVQNFSQNNFVNQMNPIGIQDSNLNPQLRNTNVGNIGSKMDLEQRVQSARTEEQWFGAGQKPGIEIWRIENFGIKRWPKNFYGQFYSGDCYIVLSTKGHRKWDVFYWIGSTSTTDEKGTAALKTIELDDLLGTVPIQFRETQGHESQSFLSLFPQGIRYLQGGIDSGFRKVGPQVFKPRLFHIKGRKNVRAMEVPLKTSSLNYDDAFLLDTGKKVLLWFPKGCSPLEKYKAAQVSQEIRNSRKTKLPEERLNQEGSSEFWSFLSGNKSEIKKKDEVQSDFDFDNGVGKNFKKIMFKLSDESGTMQFYKVQEVMPNQKLDRSKLDTMDVFIIDAGEEIIAWIGIGASPDERKKAILYATNFLGQLKKPVWTRIVRIEEGREGKKFWEMF